MNNSGEAKIMNMLAEARQRAAKPRHVMPGPLSDKVRLFNQLGFDYNASGEDYPAFNRTGSIIYKPRRDSNSFLAGVLSQVDNAAMPIMTRDLMWVKFPVKVALKPSVWMLDTSTDVPRGLHLTPDSRAQIKLPRNSGRVALEYWCASKWKVTPKPVPKFIVDVVQTLCASMRVPDYITVDCLNDRVFDLHNKLDVQDIDFNQHYTLSINFGPAPDRYFYDIDIHSLVLSA